jgi:error-prone DNA polymerase
MGADYIELRTRSAFSFLEGATTPEDIATRAAELGYEAIALGDRDGLYGAARFHQAAAKAGIRPIVGAEITLDDESRLYLLVPDRERYRNLCRMITDSKLRAAKGRGRVTLADLERYGSGLICLAGGAFSPLVRMLQRGVDPRPLCDRIAGIFGRGNFFIDIQRHADPDEERINRRLAALAAAVRIPLVATNDVCHAGSDRQLLDVLNCIRMGINLEEAGRALWINNQRHLKPPAAMAALFPDLPHAVHNTRLIAERCRFTLADSGYRFPEYPLPSGESADSYLRILTEAGVRERWGARPSDRVRRQLEHELGIIERLGLAGYFLIVWDIVRFCRENKILAQGRGSAANSAVCYALGITAIDAVGMNLLFERFLSEERGEWPDIDLDLPSGNQREKVIQYVYHRYGPRGAAMTANVITYRTRSAVREVGKVLGFTLEQIERLARLIRAYEFRDRYDDLAAMVERGGVDAAAPRIRMLLELVGRMRAIPRHLGQHSGGMVIAAGPLDAIVPLEPAAMPGRVVIQWDKDDCADLGIIKIDLLGLGMLAVLEQSIELIHRHEGVAIDLAHLPSDDQAVYAMLQRADTIGVFQVESRAQMATLPRMKPRTFYDLVVEVAIIRPGPIVGRMVHPYLDRRNGREPVRYPHPALRPILERTLGVPLFQEQLLRMAMTVADFSGGEAEELRRAMGFKRSTERMAAIEARLRTGMARRGIRGRAADEIAQSITSFALYGFPESHAASFALIAYASAYLKCHHPAAFFAAMLNCHPLGFYHPAVLVKDAQRHGVEVRAVDIMRSDWDCTLESGALRLGLKYVRGLGEACGMRTMQERRKRPFESLADFTARVGPERRDLDSLAHAGAFACFGLTRRDALWNAAAIERGPTNILSRGRPPTVRAPLPAMSAIEETIADYESTGVTVGPHLMAHLRDRLDRDGILSARCLENLPNGTWARTAGVVIVRQRPGTAKGFLFVTLEDETGIANLIVAPGLFQANRILLNNAAILIAEGILQTADGVTAIRAQRFAELKLSGATPPSHDYH